MDYNYDYITFIDTVDCEDHSKSKENVHGQ